METRESLNLKHKDELLGLLRARGQRGYSGKKKSDLIEMILNPGSAPAMKSPGRPPGSGTKTKADEAKKPRAAGKSELTVEYTKDGLNGTTAEVLRKLAHHQGIEAVSNKKKADIIDLLMKKSLATSVIIAITTKSGNETSVTVLASGLRSTSSAPSVLVPQGAVVPPPVTHGLVAVPLGQVAAPMSGIVPPPVGYVPAVGFRQ
jgi:hypothetical protein